MRQNAKRHFNSAVKSNRKPEGAGNSYTKVLNDDATRILLENGFDRNGRPLKNKSNYYK